MNILLSAYACEPHKGSEPGIGWRWAVELAALGNRVWVITRENNRDHIEAALASSDNKNLSFIYFDLPAWSRWWKKCPGGVYLYYLLWQIGVYRVARGWTRKIHFDLAHHVTFGVHRHPSFLGMLGLPFILGPVGGGESTPRALRQGYPWRGRLMDSVRDLLNRLVMLDPLVRATFDHATLILCRTRETAFSIPAPYRDKCRVQKDIGVGIDLPTLSESNLAFNLTNSVPKEDSFRLLYVGRLLYWKGGHLGLRAFSKFREMVPNARLTIVGSGPEERWLRRMAENLEITESVDWFDWLPRDEVLKLYPEHQVFLFPSLHDSGGMVVLEALSYGLPVVCLDLGGPGVIVDATCGYAVATTGASEEQVVAELAKQLVHLALEPTKYQKCVEGALARARQNQWRDVVSRVYAAVDRLTGQ